MGFRLINPDMTAGTGVHPAASTLPQTIKTFTLNASDDEYIGIIATIDIVGGGSAPTAQALPIILNIGANSFTDYWWMTTTTSTKYCMTLFILAESRAGDTCTVQLGGGLTGDANTTVNCSNWAIFAASGTQQGT